MHVHFERTVNAKSDCTILSLTWMGKAPDEHSEDEPWKHCRVNYYQEGWLATGNVRGIVGVTYTSTHYKRNDYPTRANYNLRGHQSEVILVKWNEPYQKLASCDSSGVIFVWIKYEGRWSIELINDRSIPVTCFSWSHDGRMALICYQDGFVLVGSVAGQRYWSSMLSLESTITCGIWTPDDQQVYFGTSSGQVIVMDVHGAMVSQVQLSADIGITAMAWSCEKFKMDEGEESEAGVTNAAERKFVLAVCLENGLIYLLKIFDDVSPILINTELHGNLCIEWSDSGELLAVAGTNTVDGKFGPSSPEYINMLKFYNARGILLHSSLIPFAQSPITAMTWGHNDKRLFLATGIQLHIAWVSCTIAALQKLCHFSIHNSIEQEQKLRLLPLPAHIRNHIANLYAKTIRCCVPDTFALRDFVSRPPVGSIRLHCTMMRHDEEHLPTGTNYILYLEYLGGLVPLLKGKRISKIRPEFVIFDPQVEDFNLQPPTQREYKSSGSSSQSTSGGLETDTSDTDYDEGCTGSPRMRRKKKQRHKLQNHMEGGSGQTSAEPAGPLAEDLSYNDTLPEYVRLVEVTSNIWGTKFKIHGIASSVPANLGQITYKTSLLHLQPRQMTLVITELRDDFPVGPDPNFNPNIFSEDEDDPKPGEESSRLRMVADNCPPIAPMSPRCNRLPKPRPQLITHNYLTPDSSVRNVNNSSKTEKEEEYPHIELSEVPNIYCDNVRPNITTNQCSLRSSNNTQNTSFVGQFSRNSSNPSGSQRHAISPLCCEGSVPALQSPKNAVAPSDIMFDRPPAQTLLSYSTMDYLTNAGNVHQVKAALANESSKSFDQKPFMLKKEHAAVERVCHGNNVESNQSANHTANTVNKQKHKEDTTASVLAGPSTSVQVKEPQYLIADSMVRSCSVGYLDSVDAQLVPCDLTLQTLRKETPKRLVLVNSKNKQKRRSRQMNRQYHANIAKNNKIKSPKLKNCVKSRSLDSTDMFPLLETDQLKAKLLENTIPEVVNHTDTKESSSINSNLKMDMQENTFVKCNNNNNNDNLKIPSIKTKIMENESYNTNCSENNKKNAFQNKQKNKKVLQNKPSNNKQSSWSGISLHAHALATLENLLTRLKEDDPKPPENIVTPKLPRSSPSSPAPSKKGKRPQSASPIRRHLLSSPLLGRKGKKYKNLESSDDETTASEEMYNGKNYRDLETFQKAQLRQKLKRGKIEPNGSSSNNHTTFQRREFVMHNKAPMWNENSQVYQLDFGGRVTQESAKNFQIEFRGKQVMQFGRIDGNGYTLDFQYPFSPLQAFAVALANVTQRLK